MAPLEGGRVGKCDVMVSYHQSDSKLVDRIVSFLTGRGFSVWHDSQVGQRQAQDDRKRGKAVLDTKIFLMIVSRASLSSTPCKDEAALAYISGKPIIPLGVESYKDLESSLDSAMKMLLAKLNWTFFVNEGDWDKSLEEMASSVNDAIFPAMVFEELVLDDHFPSGPGRSSMDGDFRTEYHSGGYRVSLKRTHSVQQNEMLAGTFAGLDFWDAYFSGKDSVPTEEFVSVFITVYGERLSYHVSDLLRQREEQKIQQQQQQQQHQQPSSNPEHGPKEDIVEDWIRQLLMKDLFNEVEDVEKRVYDAICTSRQNRLALSPQQQQQQPSQQTVQSDNFYRRVKEYAIGKLAMLKVFNMNSSVRLVAIQNLGLYQTPEIVAGLIELLNDNDPNIRTVATLALGRCNSSSDITSIVGHLLAMVSDSDRLVRQAACISLGHLRAGDAVKILVDIWRNEPISDVRNAALKALERMEGDDAKIAIKMTRKLDEEVKRLKGP